MIKDTRYEISKMVIVNICFAYCFLNSILYGSSYQDLANTTQPDLANTTQPEGYVSMNDDIDIERKLKTFTLF